MESGLTSLCDFELLFTGTIHVYYASRPMVLPGQALGGRELSRDFPLRTILKILLA